MSGTKITEFEGHLAEIMWRADVKLDIYEGFFRQLRSVYTLNGPPEYKYPTPLFNTWSGMADSSNSQLESWEIKPSNTDAESESGASADEGSNHSIQHYSAQFSSSSDQIPPNRVLSSSELRERRARANDDSFDNLMHQMFSVSDESTEDADRTITENIPGNLDAISSQTHNIEEAACTTCPSIKEQASSSKPRGSLRKRNRNKEKGNDTQAIIISDDSDPVPGPSSSKASGATSKMTKISSANKDKKVHKMRTDKVCHPPLNKEKKTEGSSNTTKRLSNPNSKSAFVWSSDDDDFQ